jgi:hypothetical protein
MTALFRFPEAKRPDPAVDHWFRTRSPVLGPLAQAWFDQMRRCGSDVRELMHDGCPVACVEDVAFGYVNVFASHVNVGFFLGADLDDPNDLLEGAGKRMRHVKLRPGVDANEMALGRLIEDAYMDAKRRLAHSAA